MLQKLQNFVIDENQNIERLAILLSQANYFEILRITHRELIHSNFLAWMLNPKSSHEIDNYFLKSFLNLLEIPSEEKIRINLSNLETTEIHREYNNIDLLIVDEELKFTVCIENKIDAGKSRESQLLDYYETVENIWSDIEHKNYYVYLTPFPRTLSEKEIEIDYLNITYQSILDILEDTIRSKNPSEDTIPIISSYIKNLRKNIMGISKEAKLAQEIYQKHKTAIEFIVNNKPSLYTKELYKRINDFFIDSEKYENLTPENKNIIRFLPIETVPYFEYNTNSWKDTSSAFAIEIFIEGEKIWIKFCYGAISVKDKVKLEKFQKLKDDNFSTMKKFSSTLRFIAVRSKSSSNYPTVANYTLLKINDKLLDENDDVYSAFLNRFKDFEENVLQKWSIEVLEEIKKP